MKVNLFSKKVGEHMIREMEIQLDRIRSVKKNIPKMNESELKDSSLGFVELAIKIITSSIETVKFEQEKKKLEKYKSNLEGIIPIIETEKSKKVLVKICRSSVAMILNILNSFIKSNRKWKDGKR